MQFQSWPISGSGVGLRTPHYQEILTTRPPVKWFEAISENYFGSRLLPIFHLTKIREYYPLVLHGVSLSIGSSDKLNFDYLKELKELINIIEPAWVSDHLSWSSFNGRYCPDLLPLPFTEEALKHVVERVKIVQDYLNLQYSFENISRYVDFKHSEISEVDFHAEVAKQADCYLLIDINNIYVNSIHHGFDAKKYILNIPKDKVRQYHLGGFTIEQGMMLDTHGAKVSEPVWELYRYALTHIGERPTLIERDNNIPALSELLQESDIAQSFIEANNGA
jgi:uncharacterized protein (UPF0276 family)